MDHPVDIIKDGQRGLHAPDSLVKEKGEAIDHLVKISMIAKGSGLFGPHDFLADFFQHLVEGDRAIYVRLPRLFECVRVP